MVKRALMFAFLVSALFPVSGKAQQEQKKGEQEENPFTSLFTDDQLKAYAENLEVVILPNQLTCENHENYCKTSAELGTADDCNLFLSMYLCDGKKDTKGLKEIMDALHEKIKAADDAKTKKTK